MGSPTFGYIYMSIILILLVVTLVMIARGTFNNSATFTGTKDLYFPPRYRNLCSSDLYGGGSSTQPDYSSKNGRTYWDTSQLLKIEKSTGGLKRSCDAGPSCPLTTTVESRLLVYDKDKNVLANSWDNELRALPSSNHGFYLHAQPLKYQNITGRNPYSTNSLNIRAVYPSPYPAQFFNAGTGALGYVTTEEECMSSCKDDCLGYFMIPNQFKNGMPYCLHLGVNGNEVKDNVINLDYSCSPSAFITSDLNTLGSVYGRIKDDSSPLLYIRDATSGKFIPTKIVTNEK